MFCSHQGVTSISQVQWLLANSVDELGIELAFSDPLGAEEPRRGLLASSQVA